VRLANRIRQQLWRYYPQLLGLSDDLSACCTIRLCNAIRVDNVLGCH
jgi:hypothetical protein